MTRKDYIVLAAALKDARPHSEEDPGLEVQWRWDCMHVSSALQRDNYRFDPARFLAACGVER